MTVSRLRIPIVASLSIFFYLGFIEAMPIKAQADQRTEPKVPDSAFTVYDGTRFRNKPDMSKYGFKSIEIVYAMRMWSQKWKNVKKDVDHLPSEKLAKKWAHRAKKIGADFAVIDIEHWPNHGNPQVLKKSLHNYIQVLQWYKQAEPNLKVGYFGILPLTKRYMSSPPKQKYFNRWKQNNDKLEPLAQKVDAFFPYLYTYSRDKKQWVANAKYTIQEARRYQGDKPVYVFLWPQYYGQDHKELDGKYIDKDFWKLQLQTARKYADGIIIWFPYKTKWSVASKAPWWEVTQQFLHDLGKD